MEAQQQAGYMASVVATREATPRVDDDARRLRAEREVESALGQVESLVEQLAVGSRPERLGAMVQEHMETGGKRLRARLALTSTRALGATVAEGIGWAAACEMLHNACLIHDDLQDGDTVRRGRPTMWARHGAAQAINAGDLLLMLPHLALEHVRCSDATRWQLSRVVARHAVETVRGQSLEMDLLSLRRFGWDDYLHAVDGKTGALFAMPVEGAALVAGRTATEAGRLADAFRPLGALFQIQDDVLDLFGEKGRNRAACDLREGKVSALVVEHLRRHPEDTTWLVDLLLTPREETTDDRIEEAVARFRDGGALSGVLDRIEGMVQALQTQEVLVREPALRSIALHMAALSLRPIGHLRDFRIREGERGR